MFELEQKMNEILKGGIPIKGTTVYVRVELNYICFSINNKKLNIDINLNEFVDSLSNKMGISRLTNLIILCYKKLEELEGK